MAGSLGHSSNICDGASIKSFSRSPVAHFVLPFSMPWRRCPNSWKNVMTSSYSISPGSPVALLACGQAEGGVVFVLVLPGKHVEVNPADAVVLVVNVIHGHFRMPCLRVGHRLVSDAVHLAADVENSL